MHDMTARIGRVCALVLILVIAMGHVQDPVCAQAGARGEVSFDVASVKQSNNTSADPYSNVDLGPMDSFVPVHGFVQASNIPLVRYITFAYKLSPEEVKMIQVQLPKWANTSDYDIVARANGNPDKDQLRLMMQALLAVRFKLALHYETREVPVLALMLERPGKLGPRLRQHKDDGVPCTVAPASEGVPEPTTRDGFPVLCGTVVHLPGKTSGIVSLGARALSSSVLANSLGVWYDGPVELVIDDTGLGSVDFLMQFTPQRETKNGMQYDPNAPTFLEALKDQLGLKFESRRAAVKSMVIDHIEKPSPN